MATRVYNFSAGPAVLPFPVLEEAREHLLALPEAGLSVLEVSHRSRWFTEIIEVAEANIRRLLSLPEHFRVLFLQGGASLQFSMVPMNLLRSSGRTAEYLVTGSWGEKAVKEARREGAVRVLWSGKEDSFRRVPSAPEYEPDPQAAYLHFTSNETIQGVEFFEEPVSAGVPLICDASSDILSRPLHVDRYGLIYAGAQKNAGPAGVTLVLLRDDFLARITADLPSMLDYRTAVENRSLYNTPPVFAIYLLMLVTRWLLRDIGGLEKMEAKNRTKAALLYQALDESDGFYQGHAQAGSRSLMNVTWRLSSPDLERRFLEEAQSQGLFELKGHRSVGGIRASIYNAMPYEGVQALYEFMVEFRSKNG